MRRLLGGLSDEANRAPFLAGFRDTFPVHLGIVPFAVIVGVTAVELGFSAVEITVMSATVFGGAAQLAAVFLMADGASLLLVAATVVMINVRFMTYSASLAPIFRSYSRARKAVASFLITDPGYALSMPRFRAADGDGSHPHWYYLGSGASMWLFWVLGTAVGAGMGLGIPDAFPVDLVLPLVFIGLLFPVVEDRPSAATAVVAGGVAAAAAGLDHGLGLLVGVAAGLLVGVSLDR